MFDGNDWEGNDEYFEDVNFDDIENEHNKNKISGTVASIQKPAVSSTESTSLTKNELKSKTQVFDVEWDLNDEDYFKDFNVDEVLQNLQNNESQQSAPQNFIAEACESGSNLSKDQFCNNNLRFTNGVQSPNLNKISRKNAILDIFKNTTTTKICSLTTDKLPVDSSSISKNKSYYKENSICGSRSESSTNNENNFKRKKSVAFSESTSDQRDAKKLCILPKSNVKSISNISNVHEINRNALIKSVRIGNFSNQENFKPQILKQTVIRKFPGPAGILPDEIEDNEVITLDSFEENNKNNKNSFNDVCSQNTKNLFTSGAWQLMMDDIPSGFPLSEISLVKENALEYSKTYKKVPYLAGIIQYIDHKPNDPHVILKDFSGKIDARIHHSICKLYPNALGTNIVILLKDVGVIVTSKKFVYVIISPKSLVSAYSDDARLIKTSHLENLRENCDDNLVSC